MKTHISSEVQGCGRRFWFRNEADREFRQAVIDAVTKRLQDRDWFVGVCTDRIKEFNQDQFDECVNAVADDTAHWDA